jgi:hypothetical protein
VTEQNRVRLGKTDDSVAIKRRVKFFEKGQNMERPGLLVEDKRDCRVPENEFARTLLERETGKADILAQRSNERVDVLP